MSIYWRFELALLVVLLAHEIATGTLRRVSTVPFGRLREGFKGHPTMGKWLLALAALIQLAELLVWLKS
jgi:hypothetical protein